MTTDTPATDDRTAALADAAATLDSDLGRLDDVVAGLADGDLHRAHRDGGWTVAQVLSHINVCTLVWLGNLTRLRHDPDLRYFFREQIGHDLTGYPPPTVLIAREQLASTRRTLATCVPATDAELLDREVEIPDLGTMTVLDWTPLITGHLSSHVDQALTIVADRALPTDVANPGPGPSAGGAA